MKWLVKLRTLPGFTGKHLPGVIFSKEYHTPVLRDVEMVTPQPVEAVHPVGVDPLPLDKEEGEDDDDDDESFTSLNLPQFSGDFTTIFEPITADLRLSGGDIDVLSPLLHHPHHVLVCLALSSRPIHGRPHAQEKTNLVSLLHQRSPAGTRWCNSHEVYAIENLANSIYLVVMRLEIGEDTKEDIADQCKACNMSVRNSTPPSIVR
ncbi:hypothetical protein DFH07DRAFT_769928 [Mycena maculata]|uniref:Uncharacterized protein n=1 Tax=Mycena maculata TaxID=230809 RepID=A0AAD7JMH9_9AGAR|nr:hypothetical protein DFH07DRAFT_769928 [Mycena maculata]